MSSNPSPLCRDSAFFAAMLRSIHFIYASTSGHSEYVVHTMTQRIAARSPDITVEIQRAERADPKDLLRGDILVLASGTWNTGGVEGQLNMHMQALLEDRCKDLNLHNRLLTFISLGDERYYYRTRCTEHFLRFQREHQGKLFIPPYVLVNEPYGQEERMDHWIEKLLDRMAGAAAHIRTPSPSSIVA